MEAEVRRRRTEAGPPNQVATSMRGERLARWLERPLLRLDRLVERHLDPALNPFAQTGAIANLCLIVALVSGVLLLLWYSPSVHRAYASMEAMRESWLASLIRSLHRYSSDACMFLVGLHALRLTLGRRIVGARWLAWVTGGVLLGLVWAIGWLGYWLVWDQRAQLVATGSAKVLDALPIFADPLARSFLTDGSVNSLLFFVVFFLHMLLPLALGVALWLHIARLSRPHFLTGRTMTGWVLGSLLALSLLAPATNAPPARMTVPPEWLTVDAWYLLPLVLTDRLSGGALWALLLLGGAFGFSAPWWLARRAAAPAATESLKCNACYQCFHDCPYEAITMVPRRDERDLPVQAQVDPARCVGCGICAGSCDSAGIFLSWLPVRDERRRVESWIEAAADDQALLLIACAESAGRGLEVDPRSGECPQLPGVRVLSVPCLGWVNAHLVERALRRGARLLLAGCPTSSCTFREGPRWTEERLAGRRKPTLDPRLATPANLRIVGLDATQEADLLAELEAFRAGRPLDGTKRRRAAGVTIGLTLAGVLTGITWLGSDLGYAPPTRAAPTLVVSFKHPGRVSETRRELSAAEQAALPAHMRRTHVIERRRAPVRLRVSVDGQLRFEHSYPAGGLWEDGISVAIERLELTPGPHRIAVAVGDSPDPTIWAHRAERTLDFSPRQQRVVLFTRAAGFRWE